MTEEGYKGGLVSRVRSQFSGKKYTISTAQELGKDYWTSNIFVNVFFGMIPNFTKPLFTIVRNTKTEAHEVHNALKEMVLNQHEDQWLELIPSPFPTEGLSADATNVLNSKLKSL